MIIISKAERPTTSTARRSNTLSAVLTRRAARTLGRRPREAPAGETKVSYSYPNPGWMMGVVGFGPNNAPDPARRVLTFSTAPLEHDLEIAGRTTLVL